MAFLEVRADDGRFIGMCDLGGFEHLRRVRLPVYQPMTFKQFDRLNITAPSFDCIEVELALWQDSEGRREVLRLVGGTPDQMANVSRAHVAGATCETEYGKAIAFMELLVRLIGLIRFHKLKTCKARVH